jgi:glycosyltransferase involved in cell wall biosynthesis
VILEAMASGTPVAAFVAPGPKDLLPGSNAGICDDDLQKACVQALRISREAARAYAEKFSWRACAEEFRRNLQPLPKPEKQKFWKRLRSIRLRSIKLRRKKKAA